MGVMWHEGGDARGLMLQAEARCEQCDLAVLALSSLAMPLLEMDQAMWERDLAEIPPPAMPACPGCDAELSAEVMGLVDVPEEDLPALVLIRHLADDTQEWCLAERPEGENPVLLQRAAAIAGPVDEAVLAQHWGRPLSVRTLIRAAVGDALADPAQVQTVRIAPELVMTLVRPPALDDAMPDEQIEAIAQDLAQGTVAALQAAGEAADGGLLPVPLAGPLREQMSTWLAPWSEEIAEPGSLIGLFGLRVPAVLDEVEGIAARHGASASEDPRSKERRAREHGERDTDDELLRWLQAAGIPFSLHVPSVVMRGMGDGITPADAIARAVCDMVAVCERAERVIASIGALRDDVAVEVVDINQVIIRSGESRVEMNLESILRKSATDADAIDQVRGAARLMESDAEMPMSMMCGCTDTWTIRHLRATDFAEQYVRQGVTLRDVQQVTDAQGNPFVALAGVECNHQVAFVMSTTPIAADDIDTQIHRDRRRVQLPVSAHLLRDAGGEVVGALVRGPNVATTLINPYLAAALLEGLGRRVPLGRSPHAVAPTTDLMILIRSDVAEDEERTRMLIDLTMANAPRLLDPHMRHGTPLGYVGQMTRGRDAAGKVPISWSAEAVLF